MSLERRMAGASTVPSFTANDVFAHTINNTATTPTALTDRLLMARMSITI